MYTLTPAFGGPGWLSKTISFLCGASESPALCCECEGVRPFAYFCSMYEQNNNLWLYWRVFFSTLNQIRPPTPPPHPPYRCLSFISHVLQTDPPNHQQAASACTILHKCIFNDGKQLSVHKRERPLHTGLCGPYTLISG